VFESVNIIAEALSDKTGFKVVANLPVFGGADPTWKGPEALSIDADNAPARDILSEILGGMKMRYVWDMTFDPESRTYVLNVLPALTSNSIHR
jgi:hypothetical protein